MNRCVINVKSPSSTASGFVGFSGLTQSQINDLRNSVLANGGIVLSDAFGVPEGVLFPA